LLDQFEDATHSAQNALLKTLEEPPDRVILMVIARDEAGLLPTVVSRCEHLHLRPLPMEDLRSAIIDLGGEQERAELLARIAGGRPGRALEYLSSPELLQQREAKLNAHFRLLSDNRNERFRYVDSFIREVTEADGRAQTRPAAANLVEVWMGLWRDALLCGLGQEEGVSNVDQLDSLRKLGVSVDTGVAHGALKVMEATLDALRRNANVRLALERLLLELPRI
jgi:DNA polymerase-3 subunit delta'